MYCFIYIAGKSLSYLFLFVTRAIRERGDLSRREEVSLFGLKGVEKRCRKWQHLPRDMLSTSQHSFSLFCTLWGKRVYSFLVKFVNESPKKPVK